jgi:hypothetical protein
VPRRPSEWPLERERGVKEVGIRCFRGFKQAEEKGNGVEKISWVCIGDGMKMSWGAIEKEDLSAKE